MAVCQKRFYFIKGKKEGENAYTHPDLPALQPPDPRKGIFFSLSRSTSLENTALYRYLLLLVFKRRTSCNFRNHNHSGYFSLFRSVLKRDWLTFFS